MGGAVDIREGRDTTQWDMKKRGKWAQGNFMIFNKYNAEYSNWVGSTPDMSTDFKKNSLHVLVDKNLDMCHQCELAVQKADCVLDGIKRLLLLGSAPPQDFRVNLLHSKSPVGYFPVRKIFPSVISQQITIPSGNIQLLWCEDLSGVDCNVVVCSGVVHSKGFRGISDTALATPPTPLYSQTFGLLRAVFHFFSHSLLSV
ncbi:hypothetical protein HGM15179_013193 [Zosterops borbonicus]|uniref:Uncharacterized protein n=1 Tax=Zosterops borbonicus TaxID=364589 RepID=A0A8K1G9J6_9PASS|nr:hypothetical protein HGM15179_013193 [Zosterops borbonicus]